jgi:hypothetical protein
MMKIYSWQRTLTLEELFEMQQRFAITHPNLRILETERILRQTSQSPPTRDPLLLTAINAYTNTDQEIHRIISAGHGTTVRLTVFKYNAEHMYRKRLQLQTERGQLNKEFSTRDMQKPIAHKQYMWDADVEEMKTTISEAHTESQNNTDEKAAQIKLFKKYTPNQIISFLTGNSHQFAESTRAWIRGVTITSSTSVWRTEK